MGKTQKSGYNMLITGRREVNAGDFYLIVNFVSSSVLKSTLTWIKITYSVLKGYRSLDEAAWSFLRDKE